MSNMKIWSLFDRAESNPAAADLSQLWAAVDSSMSSLPTNGKLEIAGDAIVRIAGIFLLRSLSSIESMEVRSNLEPVLPLDCFSRFVRQSMSVDFDRFIKSDRLFRSANQESSVIVSIDNRQELIDNAGDIPEIDLQDLLSLAGTEKPTDWSRKIQDWFTTSENQVVSLNKLCKNLNMSVVEVWLGLLLAPENFCTIKQCDLNNFYSSKGIFITLN